ncbi:hypothetical protein ABZ922_03100 [Streptomyces shenzhenensis]|uniref:hypothetical protein n=1 Tax=Streptomyces shenzhenensis TaxID=943815 RepID=UPI0033E92FDA
MSLPPARLRAVRGLALTATVLLTVSGCLTREPERAAAEPGAVPPSTEHRTPDRTPALTAAQAQDALITEADLGVPWGPTEGTATWRDGLLKAATDMPECQQLLDALYTEELFGDVPGTRAVTALDDGDQGGQLRYQVATRGQAAVNRTLAWLNGLPQTCGRFTAETQSAGPQDVEVAEMELPQVGDARQGLRITLTGEPATEDDAYPVLTLEVAAVRAGEEAIVVTNGTLGEVSKDATDQALELGTQRLTQIREQGRAKA